jgi:hypothetical protein
MELPCFVHWHSGGPAVAVATWDFGEIAVKEAAKCLLQGKVRFMCCCLLLLCCLCACVRACVRACMRVCVCACVCVYVASGIMDEIR